MKGAGIIIGLVALALVAGASSSAQDTDEDIEPDEDGNAPADKPAPDLDPDGKYLKLAEEFNAVLVKLFGVGEGVSPRNMWTIVDAEARGYAVVAYTGKFALQPNLAEIENDWYESEQTDLDSKVAIGRVVEWSQQAFADMPRMKLDKLTEGVVERLKPAPTEPEDADIDGGGPPEGQDTCVPFDWSVFGIANTPEMEDVDWSIYGLDLMEGAKLLGAYNALLAGELCTRWTAMPDLPGGWWTTPEGKESGLLPSENIRWAAAELFHERTDKVPDNWNQVEAELSFLGDNVLE